MPEECFYDQLDKIAALIVIISRFLSIAFLRASIRESRSQLGKDSVSARYSDTWLRLDLNRA